MFVWAAALLNSACLCLTLINNGDAVAKNIREITLALAGVCQAAHLAQQLAHQGSCPPEVFRVSLQSLVDLNPPDTLAVHGGDEANLRFGLETLIAVLHNPSRQGVSAELTRYTLSLLMLERKLHNNRKALQQLTQRISGLDRQLQHYALDSDTVIAAIAGIYVDVISPIGPRIQVSGSSAVLQNSQVQSKVRAALLTGIRSAVLWQQVGGSRLHLMFSRSRIVGEAKSILSRLSPGC